MKSKTCASVDRPLANTIIEFVVREVEERRKEREEKRTGEKRERGGG